MKIVFKNVKTLPKTVTRKVVKTTVITSHVTRAWKQKNIWYWKSDLKKRLLFIAVIILFDVDLISTSWKCPSRSWWIDQSPARMKTKVLHISWIADSFVGDTRPNMSNDQDKYCFFKKRSFKYDVNKILLWVCCQGKKLVHVSWAYVH